jgi:hypothetical protein
MIRQNRVAIGLGILLLLLMSAVAYLKSEEEKGDGHPSSYSALRKGAKAAFLILQRSGYPIERWEHPPRELPANANGILLVVAEPVHYPGNEESAALSRFLLHGGSVLLAGLLPDVFVGKAAATIGRRRIGSVECKAAAPTRLTRGGSISMDGSFQWDPNDRAPVVHFQDENGSAVVVSYQVSNGSVIWWASAWPLENVGIREKNNLELLLNSTSGYKRILWDEYYQDEHWRTSAHKPLRAYKWALAQLAVIAVAVVLTFSRRSGPLVPRLPESRLSPLEFVETLGNVFRRARSTHVAVEIAFQRFRQIAVRRLGIRGTSNVTEIVDAMAHRGIRLSQEVAELVRTSEFAANDASLTERAALQYVRALNSATRAMDPQPTVTTNKDVPNENERERNES